MKVSSLEHSLYDNKSSNSLLQSNMLVTPLLFNANDDHTTIMNSPPNDETEEHRNNSSSSSSSQPRGTVSKRRSQVKNACVNCQKACKKCDEGRPCQRCIKLGITDTCFDSPRKERKKGFKRGPYRKKSVSTQQHIIPKRDISAETSPLFTTTVTTKKQENLKVNTSLIPTADWSTVSTPSYHETATYNNQPTTTTVTIAHQNYYYDYSPHRNTTTNFSNFDRNNSMQFMTAANNNINNQYTTITTPTTNNNHYYSNAYHQQQYNDSNEYNYYSHNQAISNNNYYDSTSSPPEDRLTLQNWTYTDHHVEHQLYHHTQNTSPFVPKLGDNAMMMNKQHHHYVSNNNKYHDVENHFVDRTTATIFNDQQWITSAPISESEMYYYPSNIRYQ